MNVNDIADFNSETVRLLRFAKADVDDGISNPQYGLEMLPRLATTLQRTIAMMSDPRAGRKGLRVSGLQPITIPAGGLNPVDGNTVALRWPKDGVVLGMRVSTTDGDDSTAAVTSVKVTLEDGETNLFTDGQTDAYQIFANINSTASPYWPLWIPVSNQEIWNITCRNEGVQNAASASFTVQPNIAFAYLSGKFWNDAANEAVRRSVNQARAARGLPAAK